MCAMCLFYADKTLRRAVPDVGGLVAPGALTGDTGFIDGYWGVPRVDANTYRLPKSVQRQYYEPEG